MGSSSHTEESAPADADSPKAGRKRRSRWAIAGIVLLVLLGVAIVVRAVLPSVIESYVNRTIDKNPMYDGKIGDVDLHLYRGAYTIKDIRLNKTTGNVPVPLFSSPRVDLAIQWNALLNGKVVGQIDIERPELNFVDGGDDSEDQTGAGGPWLQIIDDLFPFRINRARVTDGSIHFRALDTKPPVNLYLSDLQASVENLSNIDDDVTPLIATVEAEALAMDHAKLEYKMKLDPASYRPTFQVAVRLLGLDVTKVNDLTRAYGAFDFERGWFDLVVELDAKEGRLEGYVKPLFRNIQVLSLRDDIKEDDVLRVFWEALVGGVTGLLENQPRDQFGTVVSLHGDLTNPRTDLLEILGNVLHNAFVRAYLPNLHGESEQIEGLEFDPGTLADPASTADRS